MRYILPIAYCLLPIAYCLLPRITKVYLTQPRIAIVLFKLLIDFRAQ